MRRRVGNGDQEDDGGPMVLLHWNGRAWSQVVLAGGFMHAANNTGVDDAGVLLEFEA